MSERDGLIGRIQEGLNGLKSPASLAGFLFWWVVLSLGLSTVSPLVVFLFAVLLGSSTGAALERWDWARSRMLRAEGVFRQIDYLWRDSFDIPPVDSYPLRVRLHRTFYRLRSGAITPEAAQTELDDIGECVIRAGIAFLKREEAGQVSAEQRSAIMQAQDRYVELWLLDHVPFDPSVHPSGGHDALPSNGELNR